MSEIALSNLSIFLFALVIVMFSLSLYARRQETPRPGLLKFVNVLRIAVLLLALVYFYFRYFA